MEDILQKLIEFVQNAAPAVWEAATRQAMLRGVGNSIGSVVSLGCLIIFARLVGISVKKYKGADEYGEADWWIMAICGSVMISILALVLFLCLGLAAMEQLVNPEWYAIKLLLGLVGSK